MSDLTSNAARSSASSSITSVANQNLQNLARGGVIRGGGMVDAFAELFATMGASTAPVAPATPTTPTVTNNDSGTLGREPVDGQQQEESDDEIDSDAPLLDDASFLIDTVSESNVPVAAVQAADGNKQPNAADEDSQDTSQLETAIAVTTDQVSANTNWQDPSAAAPEPAAANERRVASRTDQNTDQATIGDGNGSLLADQATTDPSIAPTISNDLAGASGAEASALDGGAVQEDGKHESRRDRRGRGGDAQKTESNHGLSNPSSANGAARNESNSIPPVSASTDVQPENAMPDAPESVKPSDIAHRAASSAVTAAAATAQQNNASSSAMRRGAGNDAIGASSRSESMMVPPPVGSRADAAANSKSAGDAKTNQADTLNRIKLIQRVSKAFQHLGPEGGVVRLRLAPSEMGTVRVEMRIQQRKVEARVVADTEAASAALREHLPELRSRLESLGMNVESIEVETDASAGQHDPSSSFHDQQAPWQRQPRPSRQAPTNETQVSRPASPILATASAGIGTGVASGVDVRL
ncbi:Flagellar hook-length control protein FliK [Rubripirellula lacrimiformis]|uniref:Flagellar hook-length control protein FliK n=1 Tax=Rubripirellula lacrimiformis TaxID=1930273 RepID=A0A517N6H7_9BACT|nr:flagellar hook-length control protein FliK [Rubripirellula lacrimiformis]QDT02746.1 Flagellar hook-length control protein FliK [Rubripirellula lacrimiformis]